MNTIDIALSRVGYGYERIYTLLRRKGIIGERLLRLQLKGLVRLGEFSVTTVQGLRLKN